jgi:hypothetical protein
MCFGAHPLDLDVSAPSYGLPGDRCICAFEHDAPLPFDVGLTPLLDLHVCGVV